MSLRTPKNPTPPPPQFFRRVMPDASEAELEEATNNFDEYMRVVWDIIQHSKADRGGPTHLRRTRNGGMCTSYRRHDPGPRSVGQPVNLCLEPEMRRLRSPHRESVPERRNAERAMPDARRHIAGRADREHECVPGRPLHGRGDRRPTQGRRAA